MGILRAEEKRGYLLSLTMPARSPISFTPSACLYLPPQDNKTWMTSGAGNATPLNLLSCCKTQYCDSRHKSFAAMHEHFKAPVVESINYIFPNLKHQASLRTCTGFWQGGDHPFRYYHTPVEFPK